MTEQDPDRAPQGYRVYGAARTPIFHLVTESSIALRIGRRFAGDPSIRVGGPAFGAKRTRTAVNVGTWPGPSKSPNGALFATRKTQRP